jgi:hypothetical protein
LKAWKQISDNHWLPFLVNLFSWIPFSV